jgi:hypothetical protein
MNSRLLATLCCAAACALSAAAVQPRPAMVDSKGVFTTPTAAQLLAANPAIVGTNQTAALWLSLQHQADDLSGLLDWVTALDSNKASSILLNGTNYPAAGGVITLPAGGSGGAGRDGTNGVNGVAGINGTNGVNGTNGRDGTNGLNGASGLNGTNGLNGANGLNGTNGMNGASGTNGVNGLNGTNGWAGAAGLNGTNGADAASMPTQLVSVATSGGAVTGLVFAGYFIPAPLPPATPSPADTATAVAQPVTLSWTDTGTGYGIAKAFDVWTNGVICASNQTATSLLLPTLGDLETLAWRVDARNESGTTTGSTWGFTTTGGSGVNTNILIVSGSGLAGVDGTYYYQESAGDGWPGYVNANGYTYGCIAFQHVPASPAFWQISVVDVIGIYIAADDPTGPYTTGGSPGVDPAPTVTYGSY